jgi:hypothetical protein
MEGDVQAGEAVRIVERAAKVLEDRLERRQLPWLCPYGGQPDVADLDRANVSFENTKSRCETSCWGSSAVM